MHFAFPKDTKRGLPFASFWYKLKFISLKRYELVPKQGKRNPREPYAVVKRPVEASYAAGKMTVLVLASAK